jgi:AcrR family transcriptional regulator
MAVTTRDRILDAAVAVLLRDGSKGLTTKAIAAQAQLTEPALYIYFKTKSDLCIAVANERIPRQEDLACRIRSRAGTQAVLSNLREQAGDVLRYFLAAMPLEIMFWADPKLRAARLDLAPVPDLLPKAIADYLLSEQRLGRVPAHAPVTAIADGLVGALFQRAFIVTFTETTLSCADAGPIIDEVTQLAAAGLRIDPGSRLASTA